MFTIFDAVNESPIPEFTHMVGNDHDLWDLSQKGYDQILILAEFFGDGFKTPTLQYWEITYSYPGPLLKD